VPLLTYPGKLQDRAFYSDPIHLNGDGSALFTSELGEDLRRWMERGGAECGRGDS